jgi:uncharacterized membrane protein YsdA (DUF1294 family)
LGKVLCTLWLALLAWGLSQQRLPWLAIAALAALNAASFYAYWVDKRAAETRQWRTPENTLHLLALLGGWPAARAAQAVLRHKTRKASFQALYWLTVALHLLALGTWIFWAPLQLL